MAHEELTQHTPERGEGWQATTKEALPSVMRGLRDESGFDCLSCLTAVDEKENITVVYHLFSYRTKQSLCVKVPLDRNHPVLPSVTDLWPSADWMEREAFDLMGVTFLGHANLQRLLLPNDWEGHPLRKDYQEPTSQLGFPTERASKPW